MPKLFFYLQYIMKYKEAPELFSFGALLSWEVQACR